MNQSPDPYCPRPGACLCPLDFCIIVYEAMSKSEHKDEAKENPS